MIKLEVLTNGAVYVDDTRITDRSTKPWGGGTIAFSACIHKRDVVQTLVDNGISIKKIDTAPYTTQMEKIT
jgi:hypothetical protein